MIHVLSDTYMKLRKRQKYKHSWANSFTFPLKILLTPTPCFTLFLYFLSSIFSHQLLLINPTPSSNSPSPHPHLHPSLSLSLCKTKQISNHLAMDSTLTPRRPCFIEEDDGLASLADMEAGFSGSNNQNTTQINLNQHNHFISRPVYYSRKASLRKMSFLSNTSPRSGRPFDARFEEHQPHFLDSCFLCKKPLGDNKDIFMYRFVLFPLNFLFN